MLSTCPNCLQQVEHEDHLFEIECRCGTRFNPFLSANDVALEPELVSHSESGSPQSMLGDFTESVTAFQELRDFGEAIIPGTAPEKETTTTSAPTAVPVLTRSAPSVAQASADGTQMITSEKEFSGYHIEGYLPPVSAWVELDSAGRNPMKSAFDAAWEQVREKGGNGLVSLRWALSSDGARVLLSGTPVRCTRVS